MKQWLNLMLVLFVVGSLLSACYEKPQVTLYEPGVYQGELDPLLAKQATDEQHQTLLKRLELVQTDR